MTGILARIRLPVLENCGMTKFPATGPRLAVSHDDMASATDSFPEISVHFRILPTYFFRQHWAIPEPIRLK
ncbi:MAG: hypothetical protein WC824_08275, partial [Bacteroidota bacterium]